MRKYEVTDHIKNNKTNRTKTEKDDLNNLKSFYWPGKGGGSRRTGRAGSDLFTPQGFWESGCLWGTGRNGKIK